MRLTTRINQDGLARKFTSVEKKARNAGNDALNLAAAEGVLAVRKEMLDVFDRPTPYTLGGYGLLKRAGSDRRAIELGLKTDTGKGNSARKYLAAEILGGERGQKRFEKALQSVGAMPEGYRAVPGAACPRDAYGNIPGSFIVQLLSYYNAFPESGYRANMTAKTRAKLLKGNAKKNIQGVSYFTGTPGDRLPLGIYAKYRFAAGSAIKPILIFVRWASYQKIFDPNPVAVEAVKRTFPGLMRNRLAAAGLNS